MKKITSLLLMCTVLHACTDKMDKEITSTAIEKINITEEAYPNHPKEIITLASGIQVDKIDSLFILGKDVILSKAQIDTLNSPLSRAAIYTDYTKHWAKGIVFYTIRPTNNPEFRQKVNAAIAHWEAKTNIRFWQVADNIKDYVEFITGDGNWSYLGRIGGSQQLSLYPDDRSSIGSAIHEIGHAIGLFHEHSRSDRDNYITINWNNIQTEYQSAFQTYVQNGYNKGEDYSYFDFSSIMLYSSQNAFANDTAIPTMTKKDGSLFKGQRTTLSNGDIAAVKHLYPNAYENDLLYFPNKTYTKLLTMAGTTHGSETYSEYVFLSKYPAREDIVITIEITYDETSRDYENVIWTDINTVIIPTGSRSATFEFRENYHWEDKNGWTNVDARINVDSIPEIYI